MIYLTGDTHGEQERMEQLLSRMADLPKGEEPNRLIICGDFGYLFYDQPSENAFLDQVEEKLSDLGGEILFCDGNHENFDLLNGLPVSQRKGGQVHIVRPHILHLMRGQCYTIEGKKFFVFGGASSMDKAYRKSMERAHGGKKYWWEQERPNDEEYHTASTTLSACGNQVDYIITHTAPKKALFQLSFFPTRDDLELVGYLDWIRAEVTYQHWYFGHLHIDEDTFGNMTCLYQQVVPLGETVEQQKKENEIIT
jgi:predicted phosphodiesterase